MVLVIEDDKHYSPARIAGNSIINVSDAESVEQISEMLLSYSERLNRLLTTYGATVGGKAVMLVARQATFSSFLTVSNIS